MPDPAPSAPPPAAALAPVARDLLLRGAALAAAAARARARLDDEAVHDLRVAARRLEAALRVWAPAGAEATARAARRAARRLRRAAGDAREIEVHVELLEDRVLPEAGPERPALLPLLDRLRARRDRARARVAKAVPPGRLERIAGAVARVAAVLDASPAGLAADGQRVAKARQGAAERLADAAGTANDERLHAARIAVKKWRYAEESRAAAPSAAPPAPLGELREVQKVLGSVHDRAVLRDLMQRSARRAARSGDPGRHSAFAAIAARLEHERLALLKGFPKRLRALADGVKR